MTKAESKPKKPTNKPPVQSPAKVKKAGEMVRSGIYKQAEIAKVIGITPRTLTSWIKRFEWTPDLSEEVRKETARKMINGMIDEKKAIEDASNEQVAILTDHKRILGKALSAIEKTMNELVPDTAADNSQVIQQAEKDGDQKLNAANKSVALGQLVSATSKVIADQRKTYKIDADMKGNLSYESSLFEMMEADDGAPER